MAQAIDGEGGKMDATKHTRFELLSVVIIGSLNFWLHFYLWYFTQDFRVDIGLHRIRPVIAT